MSQQIQSILPVLVMSQALQGLGRPRQQRGIGGAQVAAGIAGAIALLGGVATPVVAWGFAPKEVSTSPTAAEFNDLRKATLGASAAAGVTAALSGLVGGAGAFFR